MLIWHKKLWLIDNGSSLYFQYSWRDSPVRPRNRFPQIKHHVLLPLAGALEEVDADLSARLTPDLIAEIVALIPDAWLEDSGFASPEEAREAYVSYLVTRLEAPRAFIEEAVHARSGLL